MCMSACRRSAAALVDDVVITSDVGPTREPMARDRPEAVARHERSHLVEKAASGITFEVRHLGLHVLKSLKDRLGTAQTLDPQGFPQGGSGMAIVNVETRAPYWKNVQMVWFLDAGNVFKNASDIRLDDLRVSSGLGVRYRSPIGPLRIDWGWKLSTRLLLTGGRERSNVLHISLGQAF